MTNPTETFTPEHVGLIYRMYRRAARKYINNPTSDVMARQHKHWVKRWDAIPDPDLMAAYSAGQI